MKQLFKINAVMLVLISSLSMTAYAKSPVEIANEHGYNIADKYEPNGTIVIAQKNGQVLYEEKDDTKWPPASMSKLMTLYLVYDAMDKGRFDLHTQVKVNDKFYGISKLPMLSNNRFHKGSVYTVDELLQIMLTDSSNAATFMLSSLVDQDDSNFVDKMNETAKQMDMKNTHYYNPAGPPNNLLLQYKPKRYQQDDDNISSARDYAILTQHILSRFPQVLEYTKKVTVTVKKGTPDEETFHTYNHSLEGAQLSYKGVDGLKTGSSDTAGFDTTITGRRNGLRIVQVMMGVENWYDPPAEFNRNKMANAIMDDVYQRYSYKKVLSQGKHKVGNTEIYVHHDLYDVVDKAHKGKLIYQDGSVHYDYPRTFINKNYQAASVTFEGYRHYQTKKWIDDNFVWLVLTGTLSVILGILALLYYIRPQTFKNLWDQ